MLALAILWTFIIAPALIWNMTDLRKEIYQESVQMARVALHKDIISNLKNNHAFPEIFPGNYVSSLWDSVKCLLWTSHNSAAIYCRVMIQV